MLSLLQPHHCVLQKSSLTQEHLIGFSNSTGANGMSSGTVLGLNEFELFSHYQLLAVGSNAGGSGAKTFLQTAI